MSFILLDFECWVLDHHFVSDNWRKTPIEFGNFINKPDGFAEQYNGYSSKYNKEEIGILHAKIVDNADLPHDGNGNLIPDDEPAYEQPEIGLSPSDRNRGL